jgi:hypothetical protein
MGTMQRVAIEVVGIMKGLLPPFLEEHPIRALEQ